MGSQASLIECVVYLFKDVSYVYPVGQVQFLNIDCDYGAVVEAELADI